MKKEQTNFTSQGKMILFCPQITYTTRIENKLKKRINARLLSIFLSIIFCYLEPLSAQEVKSNYFNTLAEEEQFRTQQYLDNINATLHSKTCFTKESSEYEREVRLNALKSAETLLRSSAGVWNLQAGYGAACANNCTFTTPTACGSSAVYRVPVRYTVSTTAMCGNNIPTNAELTAQINIMNDFYVCQGLPIQYYEVATPRTADLGCTYNSAAVTDLPNVVNIYVFDNTGNGASCNGFAPLPFTTSSSTAIVMARACFNGFVYTPSTLSCASPNLGFGQVVIHEFGHYLGLFHTHETDIKMNGATTNDCDNPTISTDDCTNGDGIADTDADPDFSGGEIGCTGCIAQAQSNCNFNVLVPALPALPTTAACALYNTPNTLHNMMSYNIYSGCINTFTPCQKSKMMDALRLVRGLQMCNRDVTVEFASGAAGTNLSICAGGAAPTFTATSSCYKWYSGLGSSATTLATGTATFTPAIGTGVGQLNNNVPGVYTWYLGDLNELNPNCRTPLTVTVYPSAGIAQSSGTNSALDACSGGNFSFTANGANVGNSANMVGWYFSNANPTTINTSAAINTTIAGAANNSTLNLTTGNVIQSNGGSPLSSLNNLGINCATLQAAGGDGQYFLTPFVATGVTPVSCSSLGSNANTFAAGGVFGTSYYTNALGPVPCSQGSLTTFTYTITINILSNTTGTATTSLKARLNTFGNCGMVSSGTSSYEFLTGTSHTFSATQMARLGAGFNPTTTQFCVSVVDPNNSSSGLSYEVLTTVIFTGSNALTLWNNNNTPTINSSNPSCFWGTPIQINCSCASCPSLTSAPPTAVVTNSSCGAGCTPVAGSITAPASPCPTGSTLQYSTDNFATAPLSSPPAYGASAMTIYTRCSCTATPTTVSPVSNITTVPASCTTPAVPTFTLTSATCSAAGSTTISNYVLGNTYTFTPTGPSVATSGLISGMTLGTSYTVTSTNAGCTSAASATFSNAAQLATPSVPTLTSVAATCSAAGSTTISNYLAANTYTITPSGPTVAAGGVISGMTIGTSYTVTATSTGCTSAASASFKNDAQLASQPTPILTSVAASCTAAGTTTISNYAAANTYTFTPSGPTVAAGGVISGMTLGTSYTVTSTNGCTSAASASFKNDAQLASQPTPILTSVAASCSAAGSTTISNYSLSNSYTFTPSGPTVAAGGVISGMTIGTSYTVTSTNGCTSAASASFKNDAQLASQPTPILTSVAASCSAAGSTTISNYAAANTYTFTPIGPSVTTGGVITGMTIGTSYTVTSTNGGCTSPASVSFSNAAQPTTSSVPTLDLVAASCSAAGSSTINNYSAANTYTFTPSGPNVTAGGVITGMTIGTSYTVTSGNGSCTSAASVPFSNAAQLASQPTPILTSVAASCSAAGSTTISNYSLSNSYTFTPSGPSMAAGGVISGMTIGTSYTVTSTNGCTSAASASFKNDAQLASQPVPILTSVAATCTAAGTTTISNYAAASTYTFTPIGPSVTTGGVITGMTIGTSYTVTSTNGGCTSPASVSFSNAAQPTTPSVPTLDLVAASCSAAGSSTINNYSAANTYTFTPSGPNVTAGGVITGMTIGTSYTVTSGNGSCTSAASVPFSNAAQLASQPTPILTSVAASCSAAGSSTISNYAAANTYTFTPSGPTVVAGGVISGMTLGASYTVTSTNAGCTSAASASFKNDAQLASQPTPILTSVAASCSAAGSTTISNYSLSNSYTFTPSGPSVAAGGVISGMTLGTSYTVTATNGCTSAASASFKNDAQLASQPTPTLTSVAATCTAAGSTTISNYVLGNTYAFTPSGPTVATSGLISGMTVGTSYTVTSTNAGCTSAASTSFSNAAQLATPSVPTLTSVAATCSAAGTTTISNYAAANTYTFTPSGPTVAAGGVISGMTLGTSYTVTATNGCTSAASASFKNDAQLASQPTPTLTSVAASCSTAGSTTISNYAAANSYTFTPSGPSVAAGGLISGMTLGTSYTVTATNAGCTSAASATFSNDAQLTSQPVPTLTSVAATCSAPGSTAISNYVAANTYTFTPSGPTVAANGLISGMTFGTAYTVIATNGSCISAASVSFSNAAQSGAPSVKLISSLGGIDYVNITDSQKAALLSNDSLGTSGYFSPTEVSGCHVIFQLKGTQEVALRPGSYKIIRYWQMISGYTASGTPIITDLPEQIIIVSSYAKPSVIGTYITYSKEHDGVYCWLMNNSIKMTDWNWKTVVKTMQATFVGGTTTITPLANSTTCGMGNISITLAGRDNGCITSGLTYTVDDNRLEIVDGVVRNKLEQPFTKNTDGTNPTFTVVVANACGASIAQTFIVDLSDNIPPNTVCKTLITTTINENGTARIPFGALENGSTDNCGIVRQLVRRVTSPTGDVCSDRTQVPVDTATCWNDFVEFTCGDVKDANIMVVLRSVDVGGNTSNCMANVRIDDKTKPTCTDQPNINKDCTSLDLNDYKSLFQEPVAFDNCGVSLLSTTDDHPLLISCGVGNVTRTWTFQDCGGSKTSCTQKLVVTTSAGFRVPVIGDENLACSSWTFDTTAEKNKILSGIELLDKDSLKTCSSPVVGIEYWKYSSTKYCQIYRIRYSVIDFCHPRYDYTLPTGLPSTQTGYIQDDRGIVTYERFVYINDNISPTSIVPTVAPICASDNSCVFDYTTTLTGKDDCGAGTTSSASNLNYTWRAINKTTGDSINSGNTASVSLTNLAFGTYTICYRITDQCGNISSEYCFDVTGKDCKSPEILVHDKNVALGGITGASGTGMARLTYEDIANALRDNCTNATLLNSKVHMERILAGEATSPVEPRSFTVPARELMFTCADIGLQNIRVWTKDESGNWNFAISHILVQDNDGICNPRALISGLVRTESSQNVADVTVTATTNNLTVGSAATTTGAYAISNLALNTDVKVTAVKTINTDAAAGITTFDIAVISKHLLGTELLASPYKLIAADVDKSGEIDATDMLLIRRFVLKLALNLPGGNFRFVDKAYTFRDASNPFGEDFPEFVNLSSIPTACSANFVAVKLGDVNDSYNGSSVRSTRSLTFNTNDMDVIAGNEYTVNIAADKLNATTFQGTFSFNGAIVKAVKAGDLANMTDANIGVFANAVTTSWNGKETDAANVLSINFVAVKSGKLSEMLTINSALTQAIANDVTGAEMNVNLKFNTGKVAGGEFALYQNQPNPVTGETTIGFNLPKDGQARLTVTSIDGKVVKVIKGDYKAGYNTVTINKSDVNASGVFYYHLETAEHSASKKMVIIE